MSLFHYREDPGYLKRMAEALRLARQEVSGKIEGLLGTAGSPITPEQVEDLERILLEADLGVETTLQITDQVRSQTRGRHFLTSSQVRRLIHRELLAILEAVEGAPPQAATIPHVIFLVGVNGVGKTTTVGKLAHRMGREKEVLVCAADTFRAAAVEQLAIWAERAGAGIVKQAAGADPSAVLFDALEAAQARRIEVLLVDTAGRLHTRGNLMQELEKMKRVAARRLPGAPHEIYLVLDATTGQNGLVQAREFSARVGLTGLVVAKLDGTAKGGIVVPIARELGLPIPWIGVGEGIEDLVPFSARAFVDALLGEA